MKYNIYKFLKRTSLIIPIFFGILITIFHSCNEPNKNRKESVSKNQKSKDSNSALVTNNVLLIDSNHIRIGKQIWCLNNLDISNYRNGDKILNKKNQEDWKYTDQGAWCYFENKSKDRNGRLYNYMAVSDPRFLAPKGYHIPSEKEWIELVDLLTKINRESDILKQYFFRGIGGWRTGGDGAFDSSNEHFVWWSNSGGGSYSTSFSITFDSLSGKISSVINDNSMPTCGFYVRCIKDNLQ
jgi:uncharacterized protein (TIGR02145 family)